ncbi:MAG: ABC transporter permease [Syntrophobacterales bacterium]|nr:ABC transporter permease [Syntrophobacterales bacterium]
MNVGIARIAIKLLISDKAKFFTLVLGVTFAVFLILQMTSLFIGILTRSTSNVLNVGAQVWIMDPTVESDRTIVPLPDYLLNAVRSIPGVLYAFPIYQGSGLVKLPNGAYQGVNIVGLDDTSLFGRPIILEGNIYDIYSEDAFIVVKDAEYKKLGSPKIGATFEINDHRGVIVGIARSVIPGLFGNPTLYTTYTRAIQYLPTTRFTISYILVTLKEPSFLEQVKREVSKIGYRAMSESEFVEMIKKYYMFKTGMGMNILMMTLVSFVVGTSIAGQTFYAFVLENLEKFGALKAIGATNGDLVKTIILQSSFVSFLGFGFGNLICSSYIAFAKMRIPNYAAIITYKNIFLTLLVVVLITTLSSYIGIRRVIRIEPFEVFRG